jgi:SPP1 family predicted phage head-tail adaptor
MDLRKRNRQVTIKAPPTAQDALGQPTGDWSIFAAGIWANVKFLSGTETIKGGAESSTAKASINIRYRTDITTAMRVELGSTVFQIKAVLPDEESKDGLNLACEVVT